MSHFEGNTYPEVFESEQSPGIRQGDLTRRRMLGSGQSKITSMNDRQEDLLPKSPQHILDTQNNNYNKNDSKFFPSDLVQFSQQYSSQHNENSSSSNYKLEQLKSLQDKPSSGLFLPVPMLSRLNSRDPSGISKSTPRDTHRSSFQMLSNSQNQLIPPMEFPTKQSNTTIFNTSIHFFQESKTVQDLEQIQEFNLPNGSLINPKSMNKFDISFASNIKRANTEIDQKSYFNSNNNNNGIQLCNNRFFKTDSNLDLRTISHENLTRPMNLTLSPFRPSKNNPPALKKVWKAQGFLIITLVRKFAQKMQNLSYIRRFNKQTLHQFQVINDLSAFYDHMRGNFYLDKGIFKQRLTLIKRSILNSLFVTKYLIHFQSKAAIIDPDSYFFIIWTSIMILMIILLLFFNPIFISFQKELSSSGAMNSDIAVLCLGKLPMYIQVVNLLIRFNTAYYRRGLIVYDRWNIFLNYIKGRLLFDCAVILIFAVFDLDQPTLLLIITMFLIRKILLLKVDLEDAFALQKKESSIYELGKLCLFILIIAHFCGCLFWYIGQSRIQDGDQSWIVSNQLESTTFYEKYVNSLYWAIVTMLTVGYGDIHPVNQLEKEIVILIMIVSCGVYAYSLMKIGVLIQEIPSENAEFKRNFASISLYMKKRNLEVKIQNEVKRYYQYLNWEKYNYSQNRDIMLDPLNQSLKRKVLMSINLQFLLQYKMFSLHFSHPFLQQLSLVMKEQEFMPDDKIWEPADLEQSNRIFFIVRGQVKQLVNSQFIVKTIDEGEFFNEKTFIIDAISNVSFVSACVSTLVFLEKKDFLQIIRRFPQDYEIYCKLRDQAKNQDFLSILDSKCETCELFTHDFNSCPQVNYKISKEKLIYGLNLSKKQSRLKCERAIRKESSLFFSTNSLSASLTNMLDRPHRHLKALLSRRNLLTSIIDYMVDFNPLNLDEESLIEYMKNIVDYHDIQSEHMNIQEEQEQEDNNTSLDRKNNNGNSERNNVNINDIFRNNNNNLQIRQQANFNQQQLNNNQNSSSTGQKTEQSLFAVRNILSPTPSPQVSPSQMSPSQSKNQSQAEILSGENLRGKVNDSEIYKLHLSERLYSAEARLKSSPSAQHLPQYGLSPLFLQQSNSEKLILDQPNQEILFSNQNEIYIPEPHRNRMFYKKILNKMNNKTTKIGFNNNENSTNLAENITYEEVSVELPNKTDCMNNPQEFDQEGQEEQEDPSLKAQKSLYLSQSAQVGGGGSMLHNQTGSSNSNIFELGGNPIKPNSCISAIKSKGPTASATGSLTKKFRHVMRSQSFNNAGPTSYLNNNFNNKNKIIKQSPKNAGNIFASIPSLKFSLSLGSIDAEQKNNLKLKKQSDGKVHFSSTVKDPGNFTHKLTSRMEGGQDKTESLKSNLLDQNPNDTWDEAILNAANTQFFSDLPELDRACSYQLYFPYNNIDKVMNRLKEITNRLLSSSQKRKRKDDSPNSKLEILMQKINSKRGTIRTKSRKSTVSPLRARISKANIAGSSENVIKNSQQGIEHQAQTKDSQFLLSRLSFPGGNSSGLLNK